VESPASRQHPAPAPVGRRGDQPSGGEIEDEGRSRREQRLHHRPPRARRHVPVVRDLACRDVRRRQGARCYEHQGLHAVPQAGRPVHGRANAVRRSGTPRDDQRSPARRPISARDPSAGSSRAMVQPCAAHMRSNRSTDQPVHGPRFRVAETILPSWTNAAPLRRRQRRKS